MSILSIEKNLFHDEFPPLPIGLMAGGMWNVLCSFLSLNWSLIRVYSRHSAKICSETVSQKMLLCFGLLSAFIAIGGQYCRVEYWTKPI